MNKYFLAYLSQNERYMLWMQKNLLEIVCPYVEIKTKGNKLIGRFKYQQTYFQNSYEIYIIYESFCRPKVMIYKPSIRQNNQIHMNLDGSLCLYHPNDYKFNTYENLALEIIPWTIKWIHYYELWLVNGNIWKGREAPHGIIR
jgi:hypothetical protein